MGKILILESNKKVASHLQEIANLSWHEESIVFHNEDDVIEVLSSSADTIDMLIISISAMAKREKLQQFYFQQGLEKPFIFFSTIPLTGYPELESFLKEKPYNLFLSRPKEITKISEYIGKISEFLNYSNSIHKNTKFRLFPLLNFYRIKEFPVDIFIKIGSDKHIKVFNKNDMVTIPALNKYKQKGVTDLCVEIDNYPIMLQAYVNTLEESVQNTRCSPRGQDRDRALICKLIYSNMSDLNLSKVLLDSGQKLINESFKSISDNKQILESLDNLRESDNYHFNHSIAIAFLVTAVCAETPWRSSEASMKLVMAAVFHDISLDKLTQMRWDKFSKDDINDSKGLSSKIKKFLLNHATYSAKILKDNGCAKSDVIKIIEQHHERPDGSGYPRGLHHNQIFPLATIFIVAEHFISEYYLNIDEPSVEEIIEVMSQQYQEGNFAKSFLALKTTLSII